MNKAQLSAKPKKDLQQPPVVVIGASAGGLDALNAFFRGVSGDTQCAYLVITHHKSQHRSLLPELLARSSGRRALEIADGMKMEPNCIYSNPVGEWFTAIEDGVFKLFGKDRAVKYAFRNTKNAESPIKVYHPVDFSFQQIAEEFKQPMIGVVLSGSGSDGALGLKTIKERDGLILVQQPASAEFTGMPESAIATGLADFILRPEDMGPPLENYLRNGGEYNLAEDVTEIIPDSDLHRICSRLHARTGNDFSSYKPSTIQRRIVKRMALHGMQNVTDYIRYLNQDESEAGLLFREMLIRVTRFFRDPEQWEFCRTKLFPKLLSQHDQSVSFRVWVPGCATGEEAYSIAILLSEVIRDSGIHRDFQIFATDLDADAITIARRGEYPAGIISQVPEAWLNRYFVYADDQYKICKSIREQIVFAPHNVIKDPPFTHIDLVSCRNLLIYLKQATQLSLLSMFHMALRQNGTLILGPSESIGESSKLFEIIDGQWKVFKRNPDILSDRDPMQAFRDMGRPNASAQAIPPIRTSRYQKPDEIAQHVWKLLAVKYAPSALVTSERGDIFYFHGKAGSLLEPAEGKPRYNVLEMGRGNLPKELPALIRSAASSEGKTIEKVMTVDRETGRVASVSVEKLQSPGAMRGLFLIVFRDKTEQPPESVTRKTKEKRGENEPTGHVFELERELEHSRESYQALLEQVETSNDELRSANEELQSTNEELQSSNEELETAKEETQSLYEELSSINSELVEKVNNLSEANDDMANLLNSTAMAILYLDNDLKLRRFTDKAREIVAVRESDEGRPINELAINLEGEQLIEDAERVLSTLQGIEKEVKTVQGHWYLMKLLPYRTRGNVIDGLICSFVEIDKIKGTENSELRFRRLLSQLPHPFVLVDAHGVVFQISEAMFKMLNLEQEAVEGMSFADLIKGRFDVQAFYEQLAKVLDGDQDSVLLTLEPAGNEALGNQSRTLEIRKMRMSADEPVLAWVSAL